ncbi:MAG: glycoside hydrolase family 31 protein [Desulfobacterales bacterium]|nr:glycoside hydrolase family 31 protein [Desulfobacterales bacterium]
MAKLNESLGDYVSHERMETGLRIVAENAEIDVVICDPAVCRIRVTRPADETSDFSYALTAAPDPATFDLSDMEEAFEIRTSRFSAKISKYPVRVYFCTLSGGLINEDDPAFGVSWIGDEITAYKQLQPGERFLGLGEKTGHLDRAGSACTNWNTDYWAYPADADPLYTSMPFYIGVHTGLCYGMFFDSTYKTTFNFGASNDRFASFSAEAGPLDYYFIHDETVAGILNAFTRLIGRMPMPPIWSLGYQQCRFSYFPDQEVLTVARQFRNRGIPADVIYLDIHYMDGFRMFTWDQTRFPDPQNLIDKLRAMGFHVAVILDPGIKIEDGYAPYEDGIANGVFVTYPDGKPYAGEVWPGWCHFPDFTNPGVRAWWAGWLKDLADKGIEGFWNDMNEPSAWGKCIPNLIEFDFEGCKATHKQAHNVYGMQMARATWTGAVKWLKNKRPFVLTRAGYTGVQRYAAVWTGDNISDDAHMLADVRMVNSMGLSGMPFSGYDIGGFVGECGPNLFARWISIGVFAPLMRGHTMINSRDAEPWCFGEEVEAIAGNFIRLRYRLLPYIYSAFYECSQTGMPVARSLAIEYAHDPMVYNHAYDHEYLFGDAILVVPVASDVHITKLYLPAGRWYDFYTDQRLEGDKELLWEAPQDKLPIFIRAGSVIPMQQPVSCTDQMPEGPLELHVYADPEKERVFTCYEDDGCTRDYQKGIFFRRDIRLTPKELVLEPATGDYESRFDQIKVYFHGFDFNNQEHIPFNRKKKPLRAESFRFFDPIAPLDKNGDAFDPYGELPVFSVTARHSREQMKFRF